MATDAQHPEYRLTPRRLAQPVITAGVHPSEERLAPASTRQTMVSLLTFSVGLGLVPWATDTFAKDTFATETLAAETSAAELSATAPKARQEAAQPAESKAQALDKMVVQGEDNQGLVVERSQSGTKTDTDLMDVPQTLSVIPQAQLEIQNPQSVAEAVRYTAGVQDTTGAASRRFDYFKIRGFDVSSTGMLRDGLRGTTNQAWPKVEPYGLERIDVLKGPSSVLYGQNAPGGVVNQISKRPKDEPYREIILSGGRYDRREGKLDISGPLDDQGQYLYRLTALKRDSDTQIDHIEDNKTFIAPSFTWRPSDTTELTLLAEYNKDEFGAPRVFLPTRGTLLSNPNGSISHNTFLDEPGLDNERTQYGLGYILDHQLNDIWTLHSTGRYSHVDLLTNTASGRSLSADLRTYNRMAYRFRIVGDVYALDNRAQADWHWGDVEMQSLVGVDYRHTREDYYLRAGAAAPIDIYEPVYGQGFELNSTMSRTFQYSNQTGLYAQQQMTFDRQWVLTLGGRQDYSKTRTHDLLTPAGSDSRSHQSDDKLTYRAGLVYRADNGLAPYVSYSTSFNPSLGSDFYGDAYDPQTAKQAEVGIRFQPQGLNSLITLSAYQLTQENVLTQDPDNELNQIQTGEVEIKGVELEGRTSLSEGLDVIASVTYNDPEVTHSHDGDAQGHQPTNTPEKMASLWLDYAIPAQWLPGLGVGAGVRYIGETYADSANTLKVPSYTLIDARLSYDLGQLIQGTEGLQLSVNVTNLTDKTYYNGCSLSSCTAGKDRNIIANLRYRW